MAEIKPLKFGFDGADPVSIDEIGTGDTLPKAALPTLTQDDVGDGTTYKQYSATEKSKLFGIEAAADVTDAVNVGTAIHSVDEKTTPVDADTMPLIDSAASNALKKVTWANIKATLKAYFDTVYTLANLGGIAHSLATAANDFLVASGSGTFVKKTLAETKTILDLGTIASQASNNVSITGGSITGITDLAIADGGTGASTASEAFTALKQDATTAATGVVELATIAEDITGTSGSVVSTPAGVAAKVAIDVNPKAFSQGVALTAVASGSNGIQVAHSALYANTTNSFTIHVKRRLASWTTAAILTQKHDGTSGVIVSVVASTGVIRLTLNSTNYDSTAPGFAANSEHTLTMVVNVGATTTTVSFYADSILLNTTAAQANVDLTNTATFYSMGTSAVRTAGITTGDIIFNCALSATEVLDLYRNGIAEADKWGSQTAVYNYVGTSGHGDFSTRNVSVTSNESIGGRNALKILGTAVIDLHAAQGPATILPTKKYVVSYDYYVPSTNTNCDGFCFYGDHYTKILIDNQSAVKDTWTSVSVEIVSNHNKLGFALLDGTNAGFSANDEYIGITNYIVKEIGATLALLPEGIQPAPGQWLDASTNKLHAMQPASGSSLIRSKLDFEFRSTNTWTASAAAQYIGGVNQNCVTTKHLITEIISRTTVTTDVENIEIGDGSDADRYVAAVTPTAAPLVHTLTNRINDGTNLKLVVTPAAEVTMTIEFIIRGIILE